MKFGKVTDPTLVDFTLPEDPPSTLALLEGRSADDPLEIHVGCAKWNRKDLKNFYPGGVRDELAYYATQFNSIELNATFYRLFDTEQYASWHAATPGHFRFFPKVVQHVSHLRRLNDHAYPALEAYLDRTAGFRDKLGTIFLQLHPNFGPKHWDRIQKFAGYWPKTMPLAVEFRHPGWFTDPLASKELYALLETYGIGNILVDTAGRRDLLHMRLTNPEAFIRFVGANHPLDYSRLDAWVSRLAAWHAAGLRKIRFFIHQNMEEDSPLLAAYFIRKLNKVLGQNLHIPLIREELQHPGSC